MGSLAGTTCSLVGTFIFAFLKQVGRRYLRFDKVYGYCRDSSPQRHAHFGGAEKKNRRFLGPAVLEFDLRLLFTFAHDPSSRIGPEKTYTKSKLREGSCVDTSRGFVRQASDRRARVAPGQSVRLGAYAAFALKTSAAPLLHQR